MSYTHLLFPEAEKRAKAILSHHCQLRCIAHSECHGTTAQKVKREDGGSVYRVTRRVVCAKKKKRGQRWQAEAGDDTRCICSLDSFRHCNAETERMRRRGGGHDYRCTLTPATLILWRKMTIIRQSHTGMIDWDIKNAWIDSQVIFTRWEERDK